MSNDGVSCVLELNSGEIEGDSNSNSKFKCNLSADSVPSSMGLNSEYCNNGGTSSGNLGLGLLQNFDESNLFQSDVSGVYEWIRQRTNSASSADYNTKIEPLDLTQTIVTTSELTSTNEEDNAADVIEEVQIGSVFSLPANLANQSQTDNSNPTFLDDLNGFQADQLIKVDPLINENVFQFSISNQKHECSFVGTKESISLLNATNENKIVSSSLKKHEKLSLPYIKVPKKCILSGKIIKKETYTSLNAKNVLMAVDQPIEKVGTFQIANDVSESCENVEPFSSVEFENSEEVQLMFTEDEEKQSFLDVNNIDSHSLFVNEVIDESEEKLNKAVVAISTNKLEDTTEIVIKTEKGEELYKGRASDILKATNLISENFCFKFDNQTTSVKKAKLQTQKPGKFSLEAIPEENTITEYEERKDDTTNEEEPITEALKTLGISNDHWDRFEMLKGEHRVWFCPQEDCDSVFTRLSGLKIHILTHYNVRPFKCNYEGCEWSFYTNFRLKRHKETHLKKKQFKCTAPSCNRLFTTIYNLQTHVKLHERPADMLCIVPGCGKAFQTRRNMESHLKEHGMEHAPYMCDYDNCGKRYYSMNALLSHCRTHQHSIDDLQCEFCEKIFDKPCRLRAHLRSHTGVKPYKCNYEGCEWAFTTSSKLHRHQAKHTQERRYPCDLCSKAFLRSEHLKDHVLKHYVTKSFKCPESDCGLTFSAKSSLYVHMKKHKKKAEETKRCPILKCDFIYRTKEEVCAHMESCHKGTSLVLMDSLELMPGDDNLVTFEGLTFKNDGTSTSGINLNNLGLEGIMVSLPEFANSTDSTLSNTSPSTVTHVVLSEGMESVPSELISTTEVPLSVMTATNITEDGCARTCLTYQDIVTERELNKQSKQKQSHGKGQKRGVSCSESSAKEISNLQVTSDIVLAAGLLGGSQENLTCSLMLQDDLPSTSELYGTISEEGSLIGGSVGEFQVLLLESPLAVRSSDFEQSTINLRDLE